MVIGDDDLEPELAREADRLERGDAAVHRDDQRASGGARLLDVGRLDAVPVAHAVRHHRVPRQAAGLERGEQQRRAAHPVDVVVAYHRDALATPPRVEQACYGFLHAEQEKRVV